MPKFESLGSLPKDRQFGELMKQVAAVRTMLERVWDNETAFQGIEITPSDTRSRGRCGVSSLYLAHFLSQQGVEATFTEGKIFVRNGVEDDHVWVELPSFGDEPLVVDVTSDQYKTPYGATWHIGQYDNEAPIIGRYVPEYRFAPDEVPHRKLLGRYALLEAKIASLPRWHQVRIVGRTSIAKTP